MERRIDLAAGSEYRFEVPFETKVTVTLNDGLAEIFGCELAPGRPYVFSGCKLAVFTFQGASITVARDKDGEGCSIEYQSNETPMDMLMHLHLALEGERQKAQSGSFGPRIMVVGQGRTTVSKILLNYAVRSGRQPLWVDLDIANGSLLFPGTISALVLDRPIDPEIGASLTTAGGPISYFYGHSGSSNGLPAENPKLYKLLMENLAHQVQARLSNDEKARSSGYIVAGLSWSDQPLCMELLESTIEAFQVQTLLVVGSERLHSDLNKRFSIPSSRQVLKIQKSEGWVSRTPAFRKQEHKERIKRYFYGPQNEYSPFPLVLSFKELHLRRIGEGPMAPTSALPIGATRKVEETRIVQVELYTSSTKPPTTSLPNTVYMPAPSMAHLILGISMADPGQEAAILSSPILGYAHVTEIDEARNKVTLLVPSHGKLPKPYMIFGTLRYLD